MGRMAQGKDSSLDGAASDPLPPTRGPEPHTPRQSQDSCEHHGKPLVTPAPSFPT